MIQNLDDDGGDNGYQNSMMTMAIKMVHNDYDNPIMKMTLILIIL